MDHRDYGSVIALQAGDEPEPQDTCPRCDSPAYDQSFCEKCEQELEDIRREREDIWEEAS